MDFLYAIPDSPVTVFVTVDENYTGIVTEIKARYGKPIVVSSGRLCKVCFIPVKYGAGKLACSLFHEY